LLKKVKRSEKTNYGRHPVTGISVLMCVVLSPIGTDLLDGFLLSIKGLSVTFVGGIMRDVIQALKKFSSLLSLEMV
jgi:hypothetical protein